MDEGLEGLAGVGPALALDSAAAVEILRDGEIGIVGRIVVSSNNALYSTVRRRCPDPEPDVVVPAVYKPIRGERPLFDFPDGTLALREVAAFRVSEATGWAIVPPTVLRDGPYGQGMVQLWLEADDSVDRVAMVVERDERLRAMALFDVVVNNADRKIGHLLPMIDGHLFGVDHGICFHEEPHLRTVLWGWRGKRIAPGELGVLERLRSALTGGSLGDELADLIAPYEIAATVDRVDALLRTRRFPQPDIDRPAIPWPPY
jgi:uncharacterized repeat protein (TIGR03843 family)